MKKYIGFDIDSKKTICCILETGKKDRYLTISSSIESMRKLLKAEKHGGYRLRPSETIPRARTWSL